MGGLNMTLAKKMEDVLKGELKPEDVKTLIDLAEFLKFKEDQNKWKKINEAENEYISEEESLSIEKAKLEGEFINQNILLQELGISENEI